MSRHWGIPATGSATLRGDKSPSPRSEPIHGSNVIEFPVQFADHQPAPSPDDRSTSGAPVAAAPFTWWRTLIARVLHGS